MLQTSVIQDLERLYIFREQQEILLQLEENPFLIPLLLEAHVKIHEYFPDAPLFLEMFIDPETVGNIHLIIMIGTKYDAKETLARLDKLDDTWWLNALDQAQGKLTTNVEFLA